MIKTQKNIFTLYNNAFKYKSEIKPMLILNLVSKLIEYYLGEIIH